MAEKEKRHGFINSPSTYLEDEETKSEIERGVAEPRYRNAYSDAVYQANLKYLSERSQSAIPQHLYDQLYTAPFDDLDSIVEEIISTPVGVYGGAAIALAQQKRIDFALEALRERQDARLQEMEELGRDGIDLALEILGLDMEIDDVLMGEAFDDEIYSAQYAGKLRLNEYLKKKISFLELTDALGVIAGGTLIAGARQYMIQNGATKTVANTDSCLWCLYASYNEIDPKGRTWHTDCDCVVVPQSREMSYGQPWEDDFGDMLDKARTSIIDKQDDLRKSRFAQLMEEERRRGLIISEAKKRKWTKTANGYARRTQPVSTKNYLSTIREMDSRIDS